MTGYHFPFCLRNALSIYHQLLSYSYLYIESILIKNYWEIPAIVYVTDTIEKAANYAHKEIKQVLFEIGTDQVKRVSADLWIISTLQAKPFLEQIAIVTPGGTRTREEITENQKLGSRGTIPVRIIKEFKDAHTFFDSNRGTTRTIVLFICTQIILGLAMNYLLKLSHG